MKKVILLTVLFALISQFSFAQTLRIWGEKGEFIKEYYNIATSIDSIVFSHDNCVLVEDFNADPLANGWIYSSNSNTKAKIAIGNGNLWVKDSLYGKDIIPTGLEIEKDLEETVTTEQFMMSATAIISSLYPNTSPIISFGLKDINGTPLYKIEVSKDSCWCYYKNNAPTVISIKNQSELNLKIQQTIGRNVYFFLNGQDILQVAYSSNDRLNLKKVFIQIKSNQENNPNKARVDLIKVCRY
jgi:hypothetical protein